MFTCQTCLQEFDHPADGDLLIINVTRVEQIVVCGNCVAHLADSGANNAK